VMDRFRLDTAIHAQRAGQGDEDCVEDHGGAPCGCTGKAPVKGLEVGGVG
jgi:hypothetical protein